MKLLPAIRLQYPCSFAPAGLIADASGGGSASRNSGVLDVTLTRASLQSCPGHLLLATTPPKKCTTVVRAAGWILLLGLLLVATRATVWSHDSPRTIDEASRKVVKIFGAGGFRGLHAYCSGFLVSSKGHIVTVWSHVLDEQTVTVVLHDGRKFPGKLVGAEPQLDLAVIKIEAEELPHFELDSAVTASPGTRVFAFSNMFKIATGDEPVTVIQGVIAARTKLSARRGAFEVPYTGPVYIVDAITNNPGSGGGVLTTRDGTLLGMVGKELRNSQSNVWINYSIPISELKTAVQEIISGKFTPKKSAEDDVADPPRRYHPLDFGLVLVPDVLFRTPAFVDGIAGGSLASQAGIKPNDLIVFANDELVISIRSLRDVLGKLEAGDQLKLVLRRNNNLISVELKVPKKEQAEPVKRNP